MNCDTFDRWLEAGMPAADAAAALAHSATCARCVAALEVERFLALDVAPAPEGFTARVMERVDAASTARAHARPAPLSALAWWVRPAAEPAAALALGLAALLMWQRDAVLGALVTVVMGVANLALQSPMLLHPFVRPLTDWLAGVSVAQPVVALELALALVPAMLWGGRLLYRWSERFVAIGAR
jgi:hypothetical protein